jgi:signal transduction histidine kinase
VLGYAQVLQEAPNLTKEQQKGVTIIQRGSEHLLTLLNDVLDVAAFDSGTLELRTHEFELAGLLHTVCEITSMRAAEKNLLFRCQLPPNLPDRIETDEQRLRQILLNVLNNAVKFTEQGSVTLRVKKLETGDSKLEEAEYRQSTASSQFPVSRIQFQVEDTGIGISAEQLQKILLPFEQIDGRYHAVDGAGLGLTICQHLLKLMGSALQIESQSGRGSLFWFTLDVPAEWALAGPENASDAFVKGNAEEGEPKEHQNPLPLTCIYRLLTLAERGNPKKLLAELEALHDLETQHQRVFNQLREFAQRYQIERCLKILRAEEEQHQKSTV